MSPSMIDILNIERNNPVLQSLTKKLHPGRFSGMSPMMSAIIGFMVGQKYTDPAIVEMNVTPEEKRVYLRHSNDVGFNHMLSLDDLHRNWGSLLAVAGLTSEESELAIKLIDNLRKTPGH